MGTVLVNRTLGSCQNMEGMISVTGKKLSYRGCDNGVTKQHLILFSLLFFRFQGSLPLAGASYLIRVKILTFRPTPTNEPETLNRVESVGTIIFVHASNKLDPH